MAPTPVRWSYAARADLLEALEHIADESPQAASGLLEEVEATAASLGAFPERGTRVPEVVGADLRQVLVGRYRLVYRVESGAVGIARLIHGARDFRSAWVRRPC